MPLDLLRSRSRLASIAMRYYLRAERRRRSNFVVTGYPKSGTTWVTQLISGLSSLTYHQNNVKFQTSGVVLHTHGTAFEGKSRLLYVVRDPRETVCSVARAVKGDCRRKVYGEDGRISEEFVSYALNRFPGARQSLRSHLQQCIDAEWFFLRFEDLKIEPVKSLGPVVEYFEFDCTEKDIRKAVERFDFTALKRRNQTSKFLAQSTVASWQDLLTEAGVDRVRSHCATEAEAFGYIF